MTDSNRAVEPVMARCPSAVKHPVMLQGWKNLASVHWRFDPPVVQRLLPPEFRVDTFDDAAWVGLIPFHMERIRIPGLPALGPLSTFPETNVRTYVVDSTGRRGVWFMSLDVTRLAPALVARASYHLPYCWAAMSIKRSGAQIEYQSRRRWPRQEATSRVVVNVGDRVPDGEISDLEHFLSARWALGSTWAGRPIWARVDHEPWVVHRATLEVCDESMLTAAGLAVPSSEPVVFWSPGVDVRIGRPAFVPR